MLFVYRSMFVAFVFGLVAFAGVVLDSPVRAEASTLEATGEHIENPAPDLVELRFAVERQIRFDRHPGRDHQQLLQNLQTGLEQTTSRVRQALLELPYLEEEDIHTVEVSIGPWREQVDRDHRTVGWRGQHVLQVRSEELGQVSEMVTRAFEAGVTRTHSLDFTLKEETRRAARNDALAGAVRNARQSAEVMAEAAGARLGLIQHVQVTQQPSYRPYARSALAESEQMVSPAIHPPAFLDVRAQVHMKFSLIQN